MKGSDVTKSQATQPTSDPHRSNRSTPRRINKSIADDVVLRAFRNRLFLNLVPFGSDTEGSDMVATRQTQPQRRRAEVLAALRRRQLELALRGSVRASARVARHVQRVRRTLRADIAVDAFGTAPPDRPSRVTPSPPHASRAP
jgi:hypothetical protein